jgi:hypothetical protein
MLLCRTGSKDAIVRDVHIYDGDKKISENKDKNLTENIGFRRFKIDKEHEVKWGIGISIGVSFTGGKGSKRMEFISAGCDFSL